MTREESPQSVHTYRKDDKGRHDNQISMPKCHDDNIN